MSSRASSDDDLVARAKAGDAEAWRHLYEHVGGRLVVWLRAQPHLDSALDADDLAHDAWVTASGRIADFGGTVDDFTGWLFGIARNLTLNANRRSIRRGTTVLDLRDHEPGRSAHRDTEPIEAADGLDWTRRMLGALSDREAQVVACIDVVGLDVAATGVALDISPTAVRVARHRALRRLRALVAAGADLDRVSADAYVAPQPALGSGPRAAGAQVDDIVDAEPPIGVGSWR